MLTSALGAGENTDSIARLIGALGGGYGGYLLSRKFTKTPGEDAKDQIDAHQKRANTKSDGESALSNWLPKGIMDVANRTEDTPDIFKYLNKGLGYIPSGVGSAAAIGAGLGGIGGIANSGMLPGAVRGGLAGAGFAGGGLLGDFANDAMGVKNPLLRMGIGAGSRLLGAHTGYTLGKKLTKTRKEQLDDAMYEWYNNANADLNAPPGMKMANAPGAIPKPIAPISTVPGGLGGVPTATPSFTPQPKAPQSPPNQPTGPSNFAAQGSPFQNPQLQQRLNKEFGGMRPGNPFGDPRPDPRPGAVRTLTPHGSGHAWTTEVPRVSDGYDHIVRGIQDRRQATRDNAYADSLTAGQSPTPEGRAAWNKARPVNFEQEMRDVRAEADKAAGPRAETWAPVPTALTPEQTKTMSGRPHAFNGMIMPDGSLGYATPSDEQVAALNAQQQMRQHQQAQATLVQRHPELGQEGTAEHTAFVAAYKAQKAEGKTPDMNAIAAQVYAPKAQTPAPANAAPAQTTAPAPKPEATAPAVPAAPKPKDPAAPPSGGKYWDTDGDMPPTGELDTKFVEGSGLYKPQKFNYDEAPEVTAGRFVDTSPAGVESAMQRAFLDKGEFHKADLQVGRVREKLTAAQAGLAEARNENDPKKATEAMKVITWLKSLESDLIKRHAYHARSLGANPMAPTQESKVMPSANSIRENEQAVRKGLAPGAYDGSFGYRPDFLEAKLPTWLREGNEPPMPGEVPI